MKNIRVFLSEYFQFLEVKFSIHLNRRVFVMNIKKSKKNTEILRKYNNNGIQSSEMRTEQYTNVK